MLSKCVWILTATSFAVGGSIAWANFEADTFDANDSFVDTSFVSINFRQTFDRAPVVFLVPTTQGSDSALIRVQNVTTSGFEAVIVESPGEDGPHVAMTNVPYIAIQPGLYEIEPGVFLDAGVQDTQTTIQAASAFGSAGGYDAIEYRQDYGATPSVLSMVQTLNNETANIPDDPSSPFMSTTVNNISTNTFDVALERGEANDGSTITVDETIGYLALQDTTGSFTDNASNTIEWEAFLSSDSIVGFDDGATSVSFGNSYSSAPLAVASLSTRDGDNGGWVRRDSVTAGAISLVIDEDVFSDPERNHTTERVSVAAFSDAFDATLTRRNIDITWNGQNANGLWTTSSNWRRWNGNDRNLQDGDVFLFSRAGSGVTNSFVTENYTPEIGGIRFEDGTSYTINAGGGSLNLQNDATIVNDSTAAQTIDVDLTAFGSRMFIDTGSAVGGSLAFGPNGTIDLSDTGGVRLTVEGDNDATISGEIAGTGGNLRKQGSGTLTLDGSTSNTYTGLTDIRDGTLELAKTGGATAIGGGIEISGGTLLLAGDNQIADGSAMNLAGGTFATAGFDEGLGSLTLSGTSEIDLSGGDSVLEFADSSAAVWSGGILTISGWNGDEAGGGSEQLLFGPGGLTEAQVGQIRFFNPAGFAPGIYSARFLSTGEVVPVPEPSTFAVGGCLAAACLVSIYRSRRKAQSRGTNHIKSQSI